MIIVDNAALSSAFSDVVTALMLFLTLPVTVASAEIEVFLEAEDYKKN